MRKAIIVLIIAIMSIFLYRYFGSLGAFPNTQENCKEITSCPPCSEESPDFPDNCTCHTQLDCEK